MLSENLFHRQFVLELGSKQKKNIFLVTKSFKGRRRGFPQNDRHRYVGRRNDRNWRCCVIWCSRTTIWRLTQRFRTTGTVKDRPRSGRPKRLTPREERYIRITSGRDHFLRATRIVDRVRRATGVRISAQSVRNKLKACRFKSIRPHTSMELTVHHKIQRRA